MAFFQLLMSNTPPARRYAQRFKSIKGYADFIIRIRASFIHLQSSDCLLGVFLIEPRLPRFYWLGLPLMIVGVWLEWWWLAIAGTIIGSCVIAWLSPLYIFFVRKGLRQEGNDTNDVRVVDNHLLLDVLEGNDEVRRV